jgi:hypothetical protein
MIQKKDKIKRMILMIILVAILIYTLQVDIDNAINFIVNLLKLKK